MTWFPARRLILASTLLPLLLAACAQWLAPNSITVPTERLQQALASHFPLSKRFAEGLDISVAAPRLTLLPDENRIVVEADLAGGASLLQRPLSGTLALSQRLVFDAAGSAVRASDVRVERLHIDGLDPALERTLERLARPLAARLLEGQTVYALKPGDIERMRAAGVMPGEIRITADGIVIALVARPE